MRLSAPTFRRVVVARLASLRVASWFNQMSGRPRQRVKVLAPDANCDPALLSHRSQQSQWTTPSQPIQPAVPDINVQGTVGGAAQRSAEDEADLWPMVTFYNGATTSISFAAEERKELENMWKTTKINKFYVPISKLPPLRGDPRQLLANKAPACYPERSVPRAHRLMHRWKSMPQLRSQLPPDHLRTIELADEMATGYSAKLELDLARSRDRRNSAMLRDCAQARQVSPNAKEDPHIPCNCCEHPSPKPWLEKKNRSAAAVAAMACCHRGQVRAQDQIK